MCDPCAATITGASWGSGDTIVFGAGPEGIWQLPGSGGTPEVLVSPEPANDQFYQDPQILPGNGVVLFTLGSPGTEQDDTRIVVQSVATGERKVLIQGASDAQYVSTGHLVYAMAGTLLAVPFDLGRLEITGSPVPMLERVLRSSAGVQYALSESGTLAYIPAEDDNDPGQYSLVWVDREGQEQVLVESVCQVECTRVETPRFSPDNQQLAVAVRTPTNTDVWIYELERGTWTRFTFDGEEDETPVWTPDGQRLTFASIRSGVRTLFWRPANGSAPEEVLREWPTHAHVSSWSPDGEILALEGLDSESKWDIWLVPIEAKDNPVRFLGTTFNENWPQFSPDGHWVAYVSDETGRSEVYVQPYPGPGGKQKISTEGGIEPVWSPKGNELFYRSGDRIMVVSIKAGSTRLTPGPPQVLFETRNESISVRSNFDVTADGQRFVMIKKSDETGLALKQITVVLNWFEELKRLVPTDN